MLPLVRDPPLSLAASGRLAPLKRLPLWILPLLLPIALVTSSVRLVINLPVFYDLEFRRLDVAENVGLPLAEVEGSARQLVAYFNAPSEPLAVTVRRGDRTAALFNEREVAHLADVKGLIRDTYRVQELSTILTLALAGLSLLSTRQAPGAELARAVVRGTALTAALLALFGLGILLAFGPLFWIFHLISFRNDLWQLDPSRDLLIRLYPQPFWRDATGLVVLLSLTAAGLLALLAWRFRKASP